MGWMYEDCSLEDLIEEAMVCPDRLLEHSFVDCLFSRANTTQQYIKESVHDLEGHTPTMLKHLKETADLLREYTDVLGGDDEQLSNLATTLEGWQHHYQKMAHEAWGVFQSSGEALLRSIDSRAQGLAGPDTEIISYNAYIEHLRGHEPYIPAEWKEYWDRMENALNRLTAEKNYEQLAASFSEVAHLLAESGGPPRVGGYRSAGVSLIEAYPALGYLADSFIYMMRNHTREADVVLSEREGYELFIWTGSCSVSASERAYIGLKGELLLGCQGSIRIQPGIEKSYTCAHIRLNETVVQRQDYTTQDCGLP